MIDCQNIGSLKTLNHKNFCAASIDDATPMFRIAKFHRVVTSEGVAIK